MKELFNITAERSVLGAMMQDHDCLRFVSQLSEDDFDDPAHKLIFAAISSLYNIKQPVDVQTVNDELARVNVVEAAGGAAYLISACRQTPTTSNAEAYLRNVKECSRRRSLYSVLRKGADKLQNGMNDIEDVLQEVRAAEKSVASPVNEITFEAAMLRTYDMLDRVMKGEHGTLKYGIPALDKLTGGMWKGQNIVIAGYTSAGKSAFAMEIAVNVALAGKQVLICSREMTVEQYTQRILSRLTGISLRKICDGELGDGELELIADCANQISGFKRAFMTNTQTVESLYAAVEASPPDLLIVDYLQLMDTRKHSENETTRMGAISIAMKRIALDMNIPVLSLSQLRRAEGRTASMPQLKDLRGSGNIEQDADVVIFLYAPEAKDDDYIGADDVPLFLNCKDTWNTDDAKRYLAINIAKQRQGALGWFPMVFRPSVMKFLAIDRTR
jgi:replicative DNA helicase